MKERKSKKYTGNKDISGVREKIIGLIPKVDVFVEMFAGGAGIAKKIQKKVNEVVLIEKDFLQYSKLLLEFPSASIINDDCLRCWDEVKNLFSENRVLFFDPPYLFSTRNNNSVYYNCEMSIHDHIDFLDYASSLREKCIIIHPTCDLYNEKLRNWNYVEIKIRYHNKTSIERIWYNYSTDIMKLDYIRSIDNFTKRQQFKRKLINLEKKFKRMKPDEKEFVLEFLKEKGVI